MNAVPSMGIPNLAPPPWGVEVQAAAQLARNRLASDPLRIVTLIGGQDDEAPVATSCVIVADTVNFKLGDRGWQMQMAGAVTGQLRLDPPGTDDPVIYPPASAIGAWIWVEDATKCTVVGVTIFQDVGLGTTWERTFVPVTGWNFVRFPATQGTITFWGTMYRIRVFAVTNAATNVTVGHVWAECPPKGQILVISDSCYLGFYRAAYPDLRARGIPVTWAPDPAILGTGSGASARMTEAELLAVADENNNSVSFHGWDGSPTSGMTAAQIRADTMQAIKWLERRGLWTGRGWRAGWVQNNAPQAPAVNNLLLAGATYTSAAAGTCWPFPASARYNVPRISIHGRSDADFDGYFAALKLTHGLFVFYTHSIDAGGGTNATPHEWEYFRGKIDEGLVGGWLEGVTFEDLFARSGGRHSLGFGDGAAVYPGESGISTTTHLP